MKSKFAVLFLFGLVVGCSSNSSVNNANSSADTTKVNNQLIKRNYTIHKVDCNDDDSPKSDSTFLLDSNKITVSICPVCYGDYVYNDTVDTCNIYTHRNRYVLITIKTSKEKKVSINKDFLTKPVKDQDFKNDWISFTSIDSIAKKEKKIIFTTQIRGYAIYYSIDLNGEVKFIKEALADVGE